MNLLVALIIIDL